MDAQNLLLVAETPGLPCDFPQPSSCHRFPVEFSDSLLPHPHQKTSKRKCKKQLKK